MSRAYFWVATVLAIYSWAIAAMWFLAPAVPIWGWGLSGGAEVVSMGQRTAVGVAGLGVALFLVRREPPSRARRAVTIGVLAAWFAWAGVSAVAFASGITGVGMLTTVGIEVVAATALAVAEFGSRKPTSPAPEAGHRTDVS